jgi:hypothetical protein
MRGWSRVLLVFIALACGCFQSRRPQIEAQREAETERLKSEARADIVHIYELVVQKTIRATCTDDPNAKPQPPATVAATAGSRTVEQQCGLVVVEILSDEAVKQFITEICGGTDDATCTEKLRQTFLARLRERYTLADWAAVADRCTAHPVDCKLWFNIELWAMGSHNQAVSAWAQEEYEQATKRFGNKLQNANDRYAVELENADLEELEHRRRVGAAFAAFSNAMVQPQPTTVHCTSNTIGTMTNTTCN